MTGGGARFDVLGIGNAIVDTLAGADEEFLKQRGLRKGAMNLADAATSDALAALVKPLRECSGGSVANTIAALASFGSRCAYIGKVRDDRLGAVFRDDMRALGVTFDTPPSPAAAAAATARCIVLVTPDARRTLQTYLGACVKLSADDVDESTVRDSRVVYLEGYLWDPPAAREAFVKTAAIAHAAGREVALTLSDPFCVDRHRESFRDLVENHIDILFANELEVVSLYQSANFTEAMQTVRGKVKIAALTRSAKGSVVLSGGESHSVDACPVDRVVDDTGAGDAYAAGFLHAFNRGQPPAACARLGGIAAAEVISHYGARPEVSLAELA